MAGCRREPGSNLPAVCGAGQGRARDAATGGQGALGGANEDFRKAPSFDARAALASDPALLERMLADYAVKYPAEIEKWRPRFREGLASGERVLIAYQPL